MRFKRLYPLSALISAMLLILFCSRTDVITGAGGSVVTDFNPGLTDLSRGFLTITLIDTAVGDAFSLPESPDPLFGTFVADSMLAGLSDDGDTLAAHMQYRIAGDTSYHTQYSPGLERPDALVRAYICFKTADGESVPSDAAIALYPSDALPGFAPVNRADKKPPVDADDGSADNRVGSFSTGGAVCTLQFRDDLAAAIFMARASRDTGLYETFAFSIVDYDGPLIKMEKPYIVVERTRWECCPKETTWVISDTIRGPVTRYSPFENAEAVEKLRKSEPYSSQLTQRTAVFRLNVGKILDALPDPEFSGGNSELLNAVVTLRYHETDNTDDLPALGTRLLSRNVGDFKALILDTLLTKDIDTMSDSASHLLRYRFSMEKGSTKLAKPYNTLSFKTDLRNVISKHKRGDATYIYVYLRAVTERSTIWWCKPAITYPPNIHSVTIETVFTPHVLHRGNDINK